MIVDRYFPYRGRFDPRSLKCPTRKPQEGSAGTVAVFGDGRAGGAGATVPSVRRPRTARMAIRTVAQVIDESAMLKVQGKWGRLIQSTTRPRSGPGERKRRSEKLPVAPPSRRPMAIVQARLRSLPAVRMM